MGKAVITGAGGGGVGSDECTATRVEVLKGYKAITKDSNDELIDGTLELTGTAADSQVLSGQTYYNTDAKAKRTGSMANRGAPNQELSAGGSYTLTAGYYTGGKVTAKALANQTSATAVAGNIISGKTAWVNGSKITGSIPTMEGQNIIPSASQQTVNCAEKYMTGNIFVDAISNLTSGNIKKGVTIGGVTGTWEGYIAAANDLYYRGDNVGDIYSYSGGLLQQDRLVTQSVNYSGVLSGESVFCSRKAFPVSGYSKLNMEIYLVMNTTTSTSDEYRFRFLCGSNAPGLQGTSLLKEVKTISKEGWYTITAPLIGVTGNQYFCFRVQTYSASKDFRPIFRIYFT